MKYDYFIRLEIANYIDDVLPIDTVVNMWNDVVTGNDSLAGLIPMANFDFYVEHVLKLSATELISRIDDDRFFLTDDYVLDELDEEGCFLSVNNAEVSKVIDSGLIADRIIDYRKNNGCLYHTEYMALAYDNEEFADFLKNISWKYLGKEIER